MCVYTEVRGEGSVNLRPLVSTLKLRRPAPLPLPQLSPLGEPLWAALCSRVQDQSSSLCCWSLVTVGTSALKPAQCLAASFPSEPWGSDVLAKPPPAGLPGCSVTSECSWGERGRDVCASPYPPELLGLGEEGGRRVKEEDTPHAWEADLQKVME